MSTEITPLAILVTDGVGERKLGMITAFCRSDQVKVKPSDALWNLVQQVSPEPGVVVVKVYTNSSHLLWGSFGSPYLDVTTLLVGTLTTQFPLAWLHLHRLLPYSPTQIVLPYEKEGDGLKFTQFLWKHCGRAEKRSIICFPLCHCRSPSSPCIPIEA